MKRKFLHLTLLLVIAFLVPFHVSSAGLYRWTDENGAVHFSDSPPQENQTAVETLSVKPNNPPATIDKTHQSFPTADPAACYQEVAAAVKDCEEVLNDKAYRRLSPDCLKLIESNHYPEPGTACYKERQSMVQEREECVKKRLSARCSKTFEEASRQMGESYERARRAAEAGIRGYNKKP